MTNYEYKVVPAPARAEKIKGVKNTDARFAHKLTQIMNELGADGWEYLRAEALPCEERTGLTRSLSVMTLNLLVFRRPVAQQAQAQTHEIAAPRPVGPSAAPPALSAVPPTHGTAPSPVPPLRAVPPDPGFRPVAPLRTTGEVEGPRRLDPFSGDRDRS